MRKERKTNGFIWATDQILRNFMKSDDNIIGESDEAEVE